jgi:hypothetical protein
MTSPIPWTGVLVVCAALLRCGTATRADQPQGVPTGPAAEYRVEVQDRDPNRINVLLLAGVPSQNNVRMGSDEVRGDPGSLVEYRTPDNLGKSLIFWITGELTGSVWGTEIYTDDSRLAAAAVHAGLVQPGETAMVRVTILPGRNSYRGEARHGVTSSQYGRWPGSYMIDSVEESPPAETHAPAPANLVGVEGDVGAAFVYRATGAAEGNVWGADIYTADSSLAAAAVHAGALAAGETGLIKVTLLPGRTFYNGVDRNGVSSRSWGEFDRSYMVDRVTSESFKWDSRTPVPRDVERRMRELQRNLRPSFVR